jgi:type II secretory pathway component GspD/PulD (secretin)
MAEFPPSFSKLSVQLQHASTRDAAAAIAPLLSKPGGSVVEEPGTRTLIISDLRLHAEAAAAAAVALDSPLQAVHITEYTCKHLSPSVLATLAMQIMSKRETPTAGLSSTATPTGSSAAAARTGGELLPSPGGRSVFILAPMDRIAAWADVLSTLDQREAIQTRRYDAGVLGAAEAARLVDQTIVASRTANPAGAAADDRWSAIADDATGSLLITGTPSQHDVVVQTLAGIAAAPPQTRRPLRTFTLKHRNVREVIGIVERLVSVGMLDAPGAEEAAAAPGSEAAPDRSVAAGEPRPVPPPPKPSGPPGATIAIEPSDSPLLRGMTRGSRAVGGRGGGGRNDALTLTADEATNTLIAVGEPRILAQLEKLLPTLDVRQPQVMIEAMLVSLSDSQTMQLGVELEKIEVSGGTLIRLASLFGLSSAGTGANAGSRTVGDAAGFSGVVLNPGDFSVVIRALETVNQGRSFSVPRVLVNNNQQATFNSSLQQPYASTNASDTVATTSFGGTFDAGTSITVRPQIAEGDHLVLDYQVTLSSFTGSATANLPPPRQENSVNSIATIPDGYTVVVGGLEAIADGEGESRVPGIGAIPIIGELFKNRTNQRSRTRFFVFLRANVMRGAAGTGFEELKYISDRAAGEAGLSDEQSAGGWPELAPRIMR